MRIYYSKAAPGAVEAMDGMEAYVRPLGLEEGLLNLVKTKASRMNDCAYCIDARLHFSEGELVDLPMAIIAINGWNRLAISFSNPGGPTGPMSGLPRLG